MRHTHPNSIKPTGKVRGFTKGNDGARLISKLPVILINSVAGEQGDVGTSSLVSDVGHSHRLGVFHPGYRPIRHDHDLPRYALIRTIGQLTGPISHLADLSVARSFLLRDRISNRAATGCR